MKEYAKIPQLLIEKRKTKASSEIQMKINKKTKEQGNVQKD